MKKILEALAGTAELMGKELSPVALSMMAKDLSEYPADSIIEALTALRKSSSRFTLDEIIKKIESIQPNGRPSSDEAWAMIPRDESASVVMTEEMAEALHIAQPLLDEGDQVAARMAFKEAYTRIIEANKRKGVAVKWFPSLGHDKAGREAVLTEAARLGRLSESHVAGLLPPGTKFEQMPQIGNLANKLMVAA